MVGLFVQCLAQVRTSSLGNYVVCPRYSIRLPDVFDEPLMDFPVLTEMNGCALRGSICQISFDIPSEKGSALKGKNLVPRGIHPFSKGAWYAIKQTGNQSQKLFLFAEMVKNYQVCKFPLKFMCA